MGTLSSWDLLVRLAKWSSKEAARFLHSSLKPLLRARLPPYGLCAHNTVSYFSVCICFLYLYFYLYHFFSKVFVCLCIFIFNTCVQGCTTTAAGWGNIFLRLNVGFLPQIAVSPSTLGTPPLVRHCHHHLHHHHRHWHHHQYHLFLSMVLQQKPSEPAAFIRDPANQSPELISYSITPSFLSILQESSYSIDHTTTCPSFLKYALFLHDVIKINIS